MNTKQKGDKGEALAAAWLMERGYHIMERNWRHKHWEIDIIASKNDFLHFIEIKTRNSTAFGNPEESVNEKKMQNLKNAAEEYLYRNPQWKKIQIDVLSIMLHKNAPTEFFLIEDVFF